MRVVGAEEDPIRTHRLQRAAERWWVEGHGVEIELLDIGARRVIEPLAVGIAAPADVEPPGQIGERGPEMPGEQADVREAAEEVGEDQAGDRQRGVEHKADEGRQGVGVHRLDAGRHHRMDEEDRTAAARLGIERVEGRIIERAPGDVRADDRAVHP